MTRVQVINEDGEVVTRDVLSRDATIISYIVGVNDTEIYETEFSPAVVQSVEYDHRGQSSSITSVCGETENRRESDEKPDLTVEGIITEDQISDAKSLKRGEEITLISDVHEGTVFVKRLTIEQSNDIVRIIPEDGEEQLAFSFQLQLGEPGGTT